LPQWAARPAADPRCGGRRPPARGLPVGTDSARRGPAHHGERGAHRRSDRGNPPGHDHVHAAFQPERTPGGMPAVWVQPRWDALLLATRGASVRRGDDPAAGEDLRGRNGVAPAETASYLAGNPRPLLCGLSVVRKIKSAYGCGTAVSAVAGRPTADTAVPHPPRPRLTPPCHTPGHYFSDCR